MTFADSDPILSCRLMESDPKLKADQTTKECPFQVTSLSNDIHSFEARVSVDVEIPLRRFDGHLIFQAD